MKTETNAISKFITIYARVSTGRQEEEETVKNQLMVTRELAEKQGYKVVKEYIDDGWSGDILARPALDQLREDAKKKIWEAVLSYDPDRIARRYSYQALVMDELKDLGLETIFVTVPSPKNSEEKILHGVRGLFAEYERVKIGERFRLGKLRKAKEGHILLSEAGYGYRYIPKHEKEHGYLEINEQEASVVKMIFKLVDEEGLTIRKLIKKLQELGIRPRKSKRGVWSTSTLSNLLRDRIYIGEAHYCRTYAVIPENPLKKEIYKKYKKTSRKTKPEEEWIKIPAPPIIDKDLFDRVQKRLRENFELCKRNKKNQYLLAGKIYCNCGRRRTGEGPMRGKHLYYRCTDRVYSYPLPPHCHEKGVNARIADAAVWSKITEMMSSPDLIMKQAKRWLDKQSVEIESSGTSINDLKKEIRKLKKEEDRYIKAYGAELITLEKLKEYTDSLRTKIAALNNQISHIEQQEKQAEAAAISLPTDGELQEFCQKAQNMLNCLSFESKRRILVEIIEKITANQQELLVEGYLPVANNNNYVEFSSIRRNRGAA